jgi:hypothetical protein
MTKNFCYTLEGSACNLISFLKGTPSQEEQKTIFRIFSGLTICEMALSDKNDFPAIFRLRKMTYWNFINSGIRQSVVALAQ